MMNSRFAAAILIVLTTCPCVAAQHCAPIYESYLSDISIHPNDDAIKFSVEYTKHGGAFKEAYQGYLIAYLDRDAAKVPAPPPLDVINGEVALVLHSHLMKHESGGCYRLDYSIGRDQLAKKMIEFGRMTNADQINIGGWGAYKHKIRVAVFIPFLEDAKYSDLKELPEDKHECNYLDDRALLFQELPYTFRICFGTVQAVQLDEGTFEIEINSARPATNRETTR